MKFKPQGVNALYGDCNEILVLPQFIFIKIICPGFYLFGAYFFSKYLSSTNH